MVVGCGIDTEERSRFDKYLDDISNSGFVKMIYTNREIVNYRSNYRKFIPISFCCKEAVFKALGDSWMTSPVQWKEIELIFDSKNSDNHKIVMSGSAKKIFDKLNCTKIISDFKIDSESVTFYVIFLSENM